MPVNIEDKKNSPVMIYFHGGAFVFGSPSMVCIKNIKLFKAAILMHLLI